MEDKIPIINVQAMVQQQSCATEKLQVAKEIGHACRQYGFFYVIGHGIDETLQTRLETLSKQFFALPLEQKLEINMSKGGIAWRGYFPKGVELTSNKPDMKEGIYFGEELDAEHPLVKAKTPLHGQNLFPKAVPQLRQTVLDYMQAITQLGHALLEGIAISLGLSATYFYDRYTKEPLQLFRIFNYPKTEVNNNDDSIWGVGEHTDYGVLTILKQDESGGLEVRSRSEGVWIEAPPVHNSFVCNIGDMLDRMTGGLYRSTPHRVRVQTRRDRLSFPFFFDPSFGAEVRKIENICVKVEDDRDERWDRASVHEFVGTYGDYLMRKVGKVFPELRNQVL